MYQEKLYNAKNVKLWEEDLLHLIYLTTFRQFAI